MYALTPRALRELTPACGPAHASFWTTTWVPRLAALVVVASLGVVLLLVGVPAEQVVGTLGAICGIAALTGVVIASGRGGGGALLRTVNVLSSIALGQGVPTWARM